MPVIAAPYPGQADAIAGQAGPVGQVLDVAAGLSAEMRLVSGGAGSMTYSPPSRSLPFAITIDAVGEVLRSKPSLGHSIVHSGGKLLGAACLPKMPAPKSQRSEIA